MLHRIREQTVLLCPFLMKRMEYLPIYARGGCFFQKSFGFYLAFDGIFFLIIKRYKTARNIQDCSLQDAF